MYTQNGTGVEETDSEESDSESTDESDNDQTQAVTKTSTPSKSKPPEVSINYSIFKLPNSNESCIKLYR